MMTVESVRDWLRHCDADIAGMNSVTIRKDTLRMLLGVIDSQREDAGASPIANYPFSGPLPGECTASEDGKHGEIVCGKCGAVIVPAPVEPEGATHRCMVPGCGIYYRETCEGAFETAPRREPPIPACHHQIVGIAPLTDASAAPEGETFPQWKARREAEIAALKEQRDGFEREVEHWKKAAFRHQELLTAARAENEDIREDLAELRQHCMETSDLLKRAESQSTCPTCERVVAPYFNAEADNYYCPLCKGGMGNDYYASARNDRAPSTSEKQVVDPRPSQEGSGK